jgi:hypothetical protein
MLQRVSTDVVTHRTGKGWRADIALGHLPCSATRERVSGQQRRRRLRS